jgi:hypothetical protein
MNYLPAARRCQRVAFSIFLCFFLRMRLRRFLIRDPMSTGTLADQVILRHVPWEAAQSESSPSGGAGTSGRLNRKSAPPPWAW